MLLNISSYASADLLDQTSQASLLKHMKKYSIAREWASNCSHYPVVHITPGYPTILSNKVANMSACSSNLMASTKTEHKMKGRLLLDVVIRQSAAIFQLLAGKAASQGDSLGPRLRLL